mgnify:CR=1 FL=1
MQYKSNVETLFLFKKIGGIPTYYRLFRSSAERGGYFLLLSSSRKDETEDIFIPFISETRDDAARILYFLYENSVTPLTALEILDEYFDCK